MRILIQRVLEAKVKIENDVKGSIGKGLLVFVGFENDDNNKDIQWITKKIIHLRIFNNKDNIMDLSLLDVNGEVLIISQFTLHAITKKGNRPSYYKAAKPLKAKILYKEFVEYFQNIYPGKTEQGIFGANMKISLQNDGPVTIIIDSKNREL